MIPRKSESIRTLTFICLLACGTAPAAASENPSDWRTPESIVNALYEVVSADTNETRDWERFRALFLEDSKMSIAFDNNVTKGIVSMTPEQLIEQTEASYKSTGFHEIPLVTRVEKTGLMASVQSSFEVKQRRHDPTPLMRGLNHFQLLNDGERWWIVSNVGVIETDSFPLPRQYQAAQAPRSGQ